MAKTQLVSYCFQEPGDCEMYSNTELKAALPPSFRATDGPKLSPTRKGEDLKSGKFTIAYRCKHVQSATWTHKKTALVLALLYHNQILWLQVKILLAQLVESNHLIADKWSRSMHLTMTHNTNHLGIITMLLAAYSVKALVWSGLYKI